MLVLAIIIALALLYGVIRAVGGVERSPSEAKAPRTQPVNLPVLNRAAWGETHPSIELHPAPSGRDMDTSWLSRAVADIPMPMVETGATLHFRITQPEWGVFDERGKPHPKTDEVVLTASVPDLGIGLELNRIVINPHENASDRRWHDFEVTVPPCTRRLRLEAMPGEATESNNAFDNLWISVQESIVFRSGVIGGRRRQLPCPNTTPVGRCPAPELSTNCAGAPASPRATWPAGALRTGARQPS